MSKSTAQTVFSPWINNFVSYVNFSRESCKKKDGNVPILRKAFIVAVANVIECLSISLTLAPWPLIANQDSLSSPNTNLFYLVIYQYGRNVVLEYNQGLLDYTNVAIVISVTFAVAPLNCVCSLVRTFRPLVPHFLSTQSSFPAIYAGAPRCTSHQWRRRDHIPSGRPFLPFSQGIFHPQNLR